MKNKRTFRNTFSLNKDIEKNLSRTKICMINPRSVLLDWKLLLRFDTPKVPLGKDHTGWIGSRNKCGKLETKYAFDF